jgi:hypothetical protein
MNQFKRAQVVMLPHLDGIIYDGNDWQNIDLVSNFSKSHYNSINGSQYSNHLYIISDDEIKEGDWFYSEIDNKVFQRQYNIIILEGDKKIIATTDTSLMIGFSNKKLNSNYLPQPSQQFIEKYIESYNKGEVITDVLVEYINEYSDDNSFSITNNPIKVNQILKVNPKDNTITIKKLKDSWNKEEIINKLYQLKLDCINKHYGQIINIDIDKWIKENL